MKDKRKIPKGLYCYNYKTKYVCPYWSKRYGKPKQNNGYCAYLEKGDWDLNKEKNWRKIYTRGRKKDKEGPWQSAYEIGLFMSLLWDRVKECRIKDELTSEDKKALKEL